MPDAIATATAAMMLDIEQLRALSQNFANIATTGYRAERAAQQDPALFMAALRAGMPAVAARATLDPRAGALTPTQRRLDLAIDGGAFFQVDTPAGPRYTRRGDFELSADGVLQTASGHAVLGHGGTIRLQSDEVEVAADGYIRQAGEVVGQLALATFADPARLVHEQGGLYSAAETPLRPEANARVRQGYLEAANVQPAAEMVRMMETMRHFGLAAQALRAYDQMLGTSISGLGQF